MTLSLCVHLGMVISCGDLLLTAWCASQKAPRTPKQCDGWMNKMQTRCLNNNLCTETISKVCASEWCVNSWCVDLQRCIVLFVLHYTVDSTALHNLQS